MKPLLFCLSAWGIVSGLSAVCLEALDLVQLQKQEAERRKNVAFSKLAVSDANINLVPAGVKKYSFSQMEFEPMASEAGDGEFWQENKNWQLYSGQDRDDQRNKVRELERKIAEAQDNIAYDENLWRSLSEQIDYSNLVPEKAKYNKEKGAELLSCIEREKSFVLFLKERLEKLQE